MPNTPDDKLEREKWQAERELRERELAIHEQDAALRQREHELKARELDARLAEQRRTRWTNPLVLAVFAAALAAAGNGVVAVINGSSQRDLEKTRNDAQLKLEQGRSDAQISLERQKVEGQQAVEEAKAEAARILEVIKTADPEKAAVNLDFLLKAGLIADERRRAALTQFLSERQPGEGPSIPPAGARVSTGRPSYNLPAPATNLSQTKAANRLLDLAVAEINRNVDEESSAERIKEYWRSLPNAPSNPDIERLPWSGAFLSWLIHTSGNTNSLAISSANLVIWNDAVRKKITFVPNERPVSPGDIVIFPRSVPLSDSVSIEELRAGKVPFAPTHSGIVYAVDGVKFTTIEPNVGNAVRLREHTTAEKIIGFIRLPDR